MSSIQCDEVKTHVVTNLISFQWSTYQCRQTIPILLILGLFYQRHLKLLFIGSVADPECLSRIPDPTFFHPRSWIPDPNCLHSGSRIRIKEFKYFYPKKWFLSFRKYDPGCFYPSRIPDQGVKKAPDPWSRLRIRNTVYRVRLCTVLDYDDVFTLGWRSLVTVFEKLKLRQFRQKKGW